MVNIKPVIIFGDSITAIGVINGLIEIKNIEIYIVSNKKTGIACYSKYVKNTFIINDSDKNYSEKTLHILKNFSTKPILMIAGNDTALENLSKNIDEIQNYGIPSFPCWRIVKKIIHKEIAYKIVEELGYKSLPTTLVKSEHELHDYFNKNEVKSRCFLKSISSKDMQKKYSTKGVVCNNKNEVYQAYKEYNGFFDGMLIQPFIEGDIDEITAVLLVVDKKQNVICASVNEKVRAAKLYGSTTLSRTIENNELIEKAIRITLEIGYFGVVGVQFKYDPVIKDFRFLEINGRFSVSTPLAQFSGQNLPKIVIENLLKNEHTNKATNKTYDKNKILWFPVDEFAFVFQKRFYINIKDYFSKLKSNGIMIMPFIKGDFVPFLIYILIKPIVLVRKLIYKK